MDCHQTNELMSLALDHQLNTEELAQFTAHLQTCEACQETYVLYQSIQANLNTLGEQDLPDGFHEDLMQRIDANKVVPLHRKFNFKQLNIAAVLVMVVVFALVGINNLTNIQKSDMKEAVMERTSSEEPAMEMAADMASEEVGESAKMSDEEAQPAMMMAEAPEAEVSADVATGEAQEVLEAPAAEMTVEEKSQESTADVADVTTTVTTVEESPKDEVAQDQDSSSELARNADDGSFTPKSSNNNQENQVLGAFSEKETTQTIGSLMWLWIGFGVVLMLTVVGSGIILRMKP